MTSSNAAFRDEIHKLAEDAFHLHLISGYGDSEYADQYQIVYQGKPRHLPLKQAYAFLSRLLKRSRPVPLRNGN
ncbi:MAG: hypothetical protein WCA35_24680 [Kovacikia sp.]